MSRNILRHITTGIVLAGVFVMVMPMSAQAAIRHRYLRCSGTPRRCHYVYYYAYSRGTPKGVTSYKPSYNVLSVGTSRRGVRPSGATAVCADGRYVYVTAVKTACASHHGVAWVF